MSTPIASIEDFLNIRLAPDQDYHLTGDIDASATHTWNPVTNRGWWAPSTYYNRFDGITRSGGWTDVCKVAHTSPSSWSSSYSNTYFWRWGGSQPFPTYWGIADTIGTLTGSIDGGGYKIYNLKMVYSVGSLIYTLSGGEIKNLGLEWDEIICPNTWMSSWATGLLYETINGAVIDNCWMTSINQLWARAAFAVNNEDGCTIKDSWCDCTVRNYVYLNGLFLYRNATGGIVQRCHSHGSVQVYSSPAIGGFCFSTSGLMEDCYADGVVVTASNREAGGFCHSAGGTIRRCWSNCTVSGNLVGGFAYRIYGTVEYCYSKGSVAASTYSYTTCSGAGFNVTADASARTRNCYSRASVSGSGDRNKYISGFTLGGYVGFEISDCFATGALSGSGTGTNFINGFIAHTTASVSDCFWDINTTGAPTSAQGTGLSTAEMQTMITFADASWSIDGSSLTLNDGYPFLYWQEDPAQETVHPVWRIYGPLWPLVTYVGDIVGLQAMIRNRHGSYILTANIDASITSLWNEDPANPGTYFGFRPIGQGSHTCKQFYGNFDGQEYTISNLYINRPTESDVGLFGRVQGAYDTEDNASIKNVIFEAADIKGATNVGVFIGYTSDADIEDVFIKASDLSNTGNYSGSVIGRGLRGSINNVGVEDSVFDFYRYAGCLFGRLDHCDIDAAYVASCEISGLLYLGGIAGQIYGVSEEDKNLLSNIEVLGLESTGDAYIGGIAYYLHSLECSNITVSAFVMTLAGNCAAGIGYTTYYSSFTDCSAEISYTSSSGYNVGGLFGSIYYSDLIRCHANIIASTTTGYGIGGLARYMVDVTVEECFATGSISCTDDAGGIAYYSTSGVLKNSWARVNITCSESYGYSGGLFAYLESGSVENSYAAGLVSHSSVSSGGLVGLLGVATFQDCFWDMTATGKSSGIGSTSGTDNVQPWVLSTNRQVSPTNSIYCGDPDTYLYDNDQLSIITMKDAVDLSATTSPQLSFQLWPDNENNYDYLSVDVSTDDGATWTEGVLLLTGRVQAWSLETLSLSSYKASLVKIRFRFTSDGSVVYEGSYIDDVLITDGAVTIFTDNFEAGLTKWIVYEDPGPSPTPGIEGKITDEMNDIQTFLNAGWDIEEVNPIENEYYPFFRWQLE